MVKRLTQESQIPNGRLSYDWTNLGKSELHYHDFWEFYIIERGNSVQTLNGENLVLNANDCILIKPSDVHIITSAGKDFLGVNIKFTDSFFKEICASYSGIYEKILSSTLNRFYVSAKEFENVKKYLVQFDLSAEDPDKRLLTQKMLLDYIIQTVYTNLFLDYVDYPAPVKDFIKVLSNPESVSLGVKELSEKSNYSYSHLEKLFKESVGISINQYITQKKLEYARQILSSQNTPILDLCDKLGYNSLSHFTHLFTKTYGVSPAKFGRQHYIKRPKKK